MYGFTKVFTPKLKRSTSNFLFKTKGAAIVDAPEWDGQCELVLEVQVGKHGTVQRGCPWARPH